uniref:Serine/threonine-protein kinase SMG1 N-terminal domain-containing protein n=1 Tax=Capra hircus TaxID=9925 RepID=A0A8C2SHP4_CAPHI
MQKHHKGSILYSMRFLRTDSASADPDNLKYSSSRDRGGSSSYGLQPSNSAVVSRQRHDDTRIHADIQNDEKGGYSVNGGSGENTYGRKSLGQELRVNNVTSPEFTSIQHGSRALAIKDMRKSQGKTGRPGTIAHASAETSPKCLVSCQCLAHLWLGQLTELRNM